MASRRLHISRRRKQAAIPNVIKRLRGMRMNHRPWYSLVRGLAGPEARQLQRDREEDAKLIQTCSWKLATGKWEWATQVRQQMVIYCFCIGWRQSVSTFSSVEGKE